MERERDEGEIYKREGDERERERERERESITRVENKRVFGYFR
jgi:hypothetical protein